MTPRPKLSPAERRHLQVVAEEHRRLVLRLKLEARLDELAYFRELMEDAHRLAPTRLVNEAFHFEWLELEKLNAGRPPSRRAFRLPPAGYEARRLLRYAQEPHGC